ncbi:MAG TPA: SIMPL domain-containing protein, partial [Candidatus Paceibacterota bacterium]|nr:SIMPL domain-containing protein [Candidatus Paceibacterota bacterium]
VESKDIKSTYGGISPRYEYVKSYYTSGERKLVGFTARQSIEVKIRDVDKANTIRTGLAEAGVDNIDGPDFSIDDEEGYKEEARAKAIVDAKEKAAVLAKDLGVKLVKIVNFSEGSNYYPYRDSMKVMSAVEESISWDSAGGAQAPSLPIGENKITSNVTITYEIR